MNPLDESDAAGNITDEYIFFGSERIACRKSTGEVNYYFADHLGTARVVTGAMGTVLDDSDFYPFGGERTGVLAASEQQVLTRLKLEGLSAKQLAKLEGSTSEEAVHHRSYRIMARLRKAASRLRSKPTDRFRHFSGWMDCFRQVSVNTTRLLAGEPGLAFCEHLLRVPITSPDSRQYSHWSTSTWRVSITRQEWWSKSEDPQQCC